MKGNEIATWLMDVRYLDWGWSLKEDGKSYTIQVSVKGKCNTTGEDWNWTGRKWRLSQHMTKSEVIQTAFKAVLTALEHEARENFKYKGKAIFGPHFDVDKLCELCDDDKALDVRD